MVLRHFVPPLKKHQKQTFKHLYRKIWTQGAILSPTLYNIFTADIPISDQCDIAKFADDTAIYTSSKYSKVIEVRLETYLQQLFHYFKTWKIVVNTHRKNRSNLLYTKKKVRNSILTVKSYPNIGAIASSI